MISKKEICTMTWAEDRAAVSATQRTAEGAMRASRRNCFVASLFLIIAIVLFDIPAARAQQSSDTAPAGNAQNGKKLFNTVGCFECHGRQGQGATQTGAARIGPPMLSFDGFLSYVRQPANNMPPYTSKAIPDQDLADIYAYLKSIPMPPKGKDIPLLNK
jgi:mono/diheme cytochrome c family protein